MQATDSVMKLLSLQLGKKEVDPKSRLREDLGMESVDIEDMRKKIAFLVDAVEVIAIQGQP